MRELLPCPFCGGLAVAEKKDLSTKVRCLDGSCGVSLTRFKFSTGHDAAASVAWNRRANQVEMERVLRLLGRAYNDAAKFGLPAHNRPLWEEIWVATARPDAPAPEQTASEAFSAWISNGPKLAAAAGCHVGIKVTEAKPALSGSKE